MRKNSFAVLATLAAMLPVAGTATFCHGATGSARPNVVVFYTDDQNNDAVGCYGGSVSTPHIDSLATHGMKFTQYYPSSPVCSSSRFGVLTGLYASRSKGLQEKYPTSDYAFVRWNTDITEADLTLGKILRRSGYATGMVGKWHNGLPPLAPVDLDADPRDSRVAAVISENYAKICDHIRRSAGFDYADGIYGDNYRWLPIPKKLQYHNQDWVTECALTFIKRNAERPFFLYFATTMPHAPNQLASLKADPRATPAGWLDHVPRGQPSRANVLARAERAGFKKDDYRKGRWAGIAWLDDGVGAVLQKLDQLGLADNTIVIFASDHASRGKMTCYAGSVPCLIRWPGHVPEGKTSDALVSNIDVAPTVLDLCGLSPSAEGMLDGRSWKPLWQQNRPAWRDSLFFEITYTRAVMTPQWKYIATRFPPRIAAQITPANRREFNQEGTRISQGSARGEHVRYHADRDFPGYYDDDQLYDLKRDPAQQHNLAADPDHAAVLREMKQRFNDYSRHLPHPFAEFTER